MAIIARPAALATFWQITPALVPVSAADVVAFDVYVDQITLSNVSGAAVTVTIKDKNSSPLSFLEAVSIAANSAYVIACPGGRYFPGGINWVASSGTAIVGYIAGRY